MTQDMVGGWATASVYGMARPQKRPGLAGFCETGVDGLTGLMFWQEVKCPVLKIGAYFVERRIRRFRQQR